MNYSIIQYGQLEERQKSEAVEIFIDGFGHLMNFSKDRKKLKTLFLQALNPMYVYALAAEGKVVGLIGLGTNKIRPVKLKNDICKDLFGNFRGSIICKQVNAIFQSQIVKEDTDLYIDILATSKNYRCKGVASSLLQFTFELQGYETYYIDVLSKNYNAKRLYEKIGFTAYKKAVLDPLAFQGFGYPIKMKKM